MAAIRLQGVFKSFGDFPPVLKDVNLDIGESEFCVFLGPSGCGKSTLLRIVAGLEDPTGGDIEIAGQRVNAVPAAKRGVAMVFQSYALFPHMTVAENMGFGLKLAKKTSTEVQQKVLEAARILQLETLLDRKPKALSGGQRQRVAIGRAIVREPGVFLFDEPLSNLDTTLRGQTRLEIAKLHASFKQSSTVYVTHDQVEAMTLADKIVLLNAGANTDRYGSIAQVGAPLELYHSPNSQFVAGFIGSPQMNFLAARVLDCNAHGVAVAVHATGQTVRTHHKSSQLQEGQELTLGIRPEHLRPCAPQAVDSVDASAITGLIAAIERLGEQTYLHFSCGDSQSLIASVPGNTAHRMGDAITLAVPAEHCHLFTADGRAVQQN